MTDTKNPVFSLGRVMIVDDEPELMSILCESLAAKGYETSGFTSGEEALSILQGHDYDLMLTDLMMPKMDGIELIRKGLEVDANLVGIIMTGHGTVQTAVEAMKIGAYDYILKPFKMEPLLQVLARAMEIRRLRLENIQLRETVAIHELGKAISYSFDLNMILNKVADAALDQCRADEVSVMLPTEDQKGLYIAVSRGKQTESLAHSTVPVEQGVAGWVARHRETITLYGEVKDPRFAPIKPRKDIAAAISMPMLAGGKLVGVMNVNITRSRRPFSYGQIKALGIMVSIVAPVLENISLYNLLLEAERKYRGIFENALEGIYQISPEGALLTVNPEMARLFGYASPEEMQDLIPDICKHLFVDDQRFDEFKLALKEQGAVQNFDFEAYRRDGSRIWVSVNARTILDQNGALLCYEGTITDITENRQVAKRQLLTQQILETLNRPNEIRNLVRDILILLKDFSGFEAMGIRLRDGGDFPYYESNGFTADFLEKESSLCKHDPKGEIMRDPQGVPYLDCMCGTIIRGRTDPSLPFFTKDGSFWTNSTTDLLAATSEEDRQSRMRNRCNGEGYESVALIPLRSGEGIIGLLQLNDRRRGCLSLPFIQFLEGIGSSIGIAVARGQSGETLKRYAEEISDLYHNAPCGYHSLAPDGTILLMNDIEISWLGYAREEIIGKKRWSDLLAPDSVKPFHKSFEVLKRQGSIQNVEFNMIRQDGSVMPVLLNAAAVKDAKDNFIMSRTNIFDITTRKLMEKKLKEAETMLVQSEKLAAIGTLAAGVTHEILNPLNIISLNLQMLGMTEITPEKMQQVLEVCQGQVERIVKISKDLNQFARVGSQEIVLGNINHLIEQTFNLIAPKLRVNKVAVDLQLRSDLPSIPLDQNRLGQVFLNLVNNAVDAMEGVQEKTLQVSTDLVTSGEMKFVRVVFADRGTGIIEENIQKIFNPFFTTKEPGKGTGLGLSITYRIIEDHGGRIWVEKNEWGGASFFIELPMHNPSGHTPSKR